MRRWRDRPPLNFALAFGESGASHYAAGLAFNAFMSMFPIIVGLVALVGLFAQSEEIHQSVEKVLVLAFPADEQPAIQQLFNRVKGSAGVLALFSLVALLWSGTNLFASMEFALNQIYRTRPRSFLRTRLMGLSMIGAFVIAVAVAVGASSAAALVAGGGALSFGAGWAVMTALLLIVYRFVPNRRSSFAEVWRGALVAGLSIELLNLAFPIYIGFTHGVTTYGRAFGFLFVLGTWTFFLSELLLAGAVMNRVRLDRLRIQDDNRAPDGNASDAHA